MRETSAIKNSDAAEAAQKQKKMKAGLLGDIRSLVVKIAVIVGAVVLLFLFVFGTYTIHDESMAPAFKDGDIVVFYRLDKKYASKFPIMVNMNGELQVRRLIGRAGDIIDIRDGGLYLNGSRQQEPRITTDTIQFEGGVTFPYEVPADHIFVLSDDRSASTMDSRLYGAVPMENTSGNILLNIQRRGF